jgi:hypothetical protein
MIEFTSDVRVMSCGTKNYQTVQKFNAFNRLINVGPLLQGLKSV